MLCRNLPGVPSQLPCSPGRSPWPADIDKQVHVDVKFGHPVAKFAVRIADLLGEPCWPHVHSSIKMVTVTMPTMFCWVGMKILRLKLI